MRIKLFLAWCGALLASGAGSLFGQTISGFSPSVGCPGDTITITGTGFTSHPGWTLVFWQNKTVLTGFINGETLVTAVVPAGVTTGPIGLIPSGSSQPTFTSSNFISIGTGPYIADFSPTLGASNDSVVITGVHLAGVQVNGVKFNGIASKDAAVSGDGKTINLHVPFGATTGPLTVTASSGSSNTTTSFTVIGPGPYITDYSPTFGPAGTKLLINGRHFFTSGATNATFNGVAGTNFAVLSDSLLQVYAPPGVVSGHIAINSPIGRFTTSSNYYAPPAVASFSPAKGRAGTNVSLTGSSFLDATAVIFGGIPGIASTNFTVVNNSNLVASVPASAISGQIRVITPPYSAFSATNFLVPPTITGFSPSFGAVGANITLTGANFTNTTTATPTVRFNGTAATSLSNIKFGQVTAQVPAGATTGPISISTSDGGHTNSALFYLPPAITSFTPTNSPPGKRVTLTGQNFLDASSVTFNGAPVSDFTVTNNTTLGVTVPAGVSTGPIAVTAPAGTATSAGLFYGAPIITNFSPTHGLPTTVVTLSGTNFRGATLVLFNGASVPISSTDNGQIAVQVPVGAQTGPITVVAPGGTNTSVGIFTLDYRSDLIVTMTDSPDPVPQGSNLTYSVFILNNGPDPAPNVWLTNNLPANARVIAATTSHGTLATNGNPVTGALGTIVVGGSATIRLTIAAPPAETLLNVASAGSDYVDSNPASNTRIETTTVLPLLMLRGATNQFSLAWHTNFSHFVLEAKSSLETNIFWSNILTAPIISASNNVLTESTTGSAKFYRLRK